MLIIKDSWVWYVPDSTIVAIESPYVNTRIAVEHRVYTKIVAKSNKLVYSGYYED